MQYSNILPSFAFSWCRLPTSGWRFVFAGTSAAAKSVRKYAISRKFPAHNRKNSAKMGLTTDGLKTVHYVLFSAIYSIIYHLVSFNPDGIQEVSGSILLISTRIVPKSSDLELFLFWR
jgi:hypothetical protein